MLFDGISDLGLAVAFEPKAAVTDNTAFVSTIFDTQAKTHVGLALVTGTDADADATFAVTLAESDAANMAGSNAVAADDLIGTLAKASYTFADDFEPRKLGYRGSKRYIQATVTPTGNTGNAFLAGLWVFKDMVGPEPNPPV